jgi:hypothetical protein
MQHWDHHHVNSTLPWYHHQSGALALIPSLTPHYSLFSQLTED